MLNTTFFTTLKQSGFTSTAIAHHTGIEQLKNSIYSQVLPTDPNSGITITWETWREESVGYTNPQEVYKLTELLEVTIMHCQYILSTTFDTRQQIDGCTEAVLESLDLAQNILEAITDCCPHRLIHIHETFSTFQVTLLTLLDNIVTGGTPTLRLGSDIGGLITANYIRCDSRKEPTPIAKSIDRRGAEISHEELAAMYRTSRVSISAIAKSGYEKISHHVVNATLESGDIVTTLDKRYEWYTAQQAGKFLESDTLLKTYAKELAPINYKGNLMYREDRLEKCMERIELDRETALKPRSRKPRTKAPALT